jgi:hypothetical protein
MSEFKKGDTAKRVKNSTCSPDESLCIKRGEEAIVDRIEGYQLIDNLGRTGVVYDFEKVPSEPTTKEEAIKLMQECKAKMEKLEAYINEEDVDVWTKDDIVGGVKCFLERRHTHTLIYLSCKGFSLMDNDYYVWGVDDHEILDEEQMAAYLNANGYKKHE